MLGESGSSIGTIDTFRVLQFIQDNSFTIDPAFAKDAIKWWAEHPELMKQLKALDETIIGDPLTHADPRIRQAAILAALEEVIKRLPGALEVRIGYLLQDGEPRESPFDNDARASSDPCTRHIEDHPTNTDMAQFTEDSAGEQ